MGHLNLWLKNLDENKSTMKMNNFTVFVDNVHYKVIMGPTLFIYFPEEQFLKIVQ